MDYEARMAHNDLSKNFDMLKHNEYTSKAHIPHPLQRLDSYSQMKQFGAKHNVDGIFHGDLKHSISKQFGAIPDSLKRDTKPMHVGKSAGFKSTDEKYYFDPKLLQRNDSALMVKRIS